MYCPECGEGVKVLNYSEEDDGGFGFPEAIVREWKCRCPKCGYQGTYTKLYELDNEEWNYVK